MKIYIVFLTLSSIALWRVVEWFGINNEHALGVAATWFMLVGIVSAGMSAK